MWDHSTATSCLQHTHSLTAEFIGYSRPHASPKCGLFPRYRRSIPVKKEARRTQKPADYNGETRIFCSPVWCGSVPRFLPGNRAEPCETRSRLQVSTNTLRLVGDKHLAARRCCRATSPRCFPSLFNASTFCSSALPKPHLVICDIVERIPQNPAYYTFCT